MTTLIAYRTAPNAEHKAAQELRQAGIKAYVPRDRNKRRSPFTGKRPATAPGYVFANQPYHPPFEKHVKRKVGKVQSATAKLIRLYPTRDRGHQKLEPTFSIGDKVEIKVGQFASMIGHLVSKRGRRQWLVSIGGRQICAQTTSLIRIDPG